MRRLPLELKLLALLLALAITAALTILKLQLYDAFSPQHETTETSL